MLAEKFRGDAALKKKILTRKWWKWKEYTGFPTHTLKNNNNKRFKKERVIGKLRLVSRKISLAREHF